MFPAQRRGTAKTPTDRASNVVLGAGPGVAGARRPLLGLGLVFAGVVFAGPVVADPRAIGFLAFVHPAAVLAAEPSPVVIDPLDPRSDGEAAGVVGQPLLAAVAVLVLGILAAAATAIYVRYARRR